MLAFPTRRPPVALVGLGILVAMLVTALSTAPANAQGTDVRVTRNLQYGTDAGQQLVLDVYQPSGTTSPHPALILIHGGGWTSGDKERYEPISRALASEGFVVFNIDYTLDVSGSPGYPRQVDDARSALAWVRQHAAEYHGDAGRLAVAGGSAGGYLAAMLGVKEDTAGAAPVRAVVSLSGPMDLVALATALRGATSSPGQCQPVSCDVLQQATTSLRALLGCDPVQCPDQLLRAASPISYVTSASPPFFLANSTEETVPSSQATSMAAALKAHGVTATLDLVPGDQHSIEYVPAISRSLLTFLAKHLRHTSPVAASPAPTQPASRSGHGHAALLRWAIVAAIVCLLVVGAFVRRRRSAGSAPRQDDLLQQPTGERDPL
jgi:acetyl esterase/lipase